MKNNSSSCAVHSISIYLLKGGISRMLVRTGLQTLSDVTSAHLVCLSPVQSHSLGSGIELLLLSCMDDPFVEESWWGCCSKALESCVIVCCCLKGFMCFSDVFFVCMWITKCSYFRLSVLIRLWCYRYCFKAIYYFPLWKSFLVKKVNVAICNFQTYVTVTAAVIARLL